VSWLQHSAQLFSHAVGIGGGLESLCGEIGLTQIESRSLTVRMDFADSADYWDLCSTDPQRR
jgi:hypothetical protein